MSLRHTTVKKQKLSPNTEKIRPPPLIPDFSSGTKIMSLILFKQMYFHLLRNCLNNHNKSITTKKTANKITFPPRIPCKCVLFVL